MCVFFKQKTAYERRISDWSSDVCSSDLYDARAGLDRAAALVGVDDPGERLEEGRLARAVAADQREPVTRTDMHVEPAEQPAGALDQTEIFICEDGSSHDGASPKAARADRQRPRIVDCRRMTDAFIG